MRRLARIQCKFCDGTTEATVIDTPTPGLVVAEIATIACRHPAGALRWTVTHERSGLLVSAEPDPETAMLVAAKLGEVGVDWTMSGADIRAATAGNDPTRGLRNDALGNDAPADDHPAVTR